MHWLDEAIVLHSAPYGEQSRIVQLLTSARGKHAGLVRGGKRQGALCQPGNRVQANWNARLEDRLGTFALELLRPTVSLLIEDTPKLHAIASACALLSVTLPEREPHPELFAATRMFLARLELEDERWVAQYLSLEMEVLSRLGYGLELDYCAATGTAENLIYVSPKTGRAVSAEGGAAYKDKLLRLPAFLKEAFAREGDAGKSVSAPPGRADILDGFRLTGYFLNKHMFAHHAALPAARGRLMEKFLEEHHYAYV